MIKISLYICLLVQVANAQDSRQVPKKLYKAWITFSGSEKRKTGALYEVCDSSLLLSSSLAKKDYFDPSRYEQIRVNVKNIDVIRVRRKNATGRMILYGGVTGAVLGAVIGLTSKNSARNENVNASIKIASVTFGAVFFGACGAVIGAVFSPIRKAFRVHGSQEAFERERSALQRRALVFDPDIAGKRTSDIPGTMDTVVNADGQ